MVLVNGLFSASLLGFAARLRCSASLLGSAASLLGYVLTLVCS